MDELLLIEAVERYLKGEMTEKEKTFFEEIRKNDPAVDHMVVEHSFLLHELDKQSNIKAYKHSLYEVENKLAEEGMISKMQLSGKAKVVFLWKKYKRNIAVAASIAGIISITTAGLIIAYTKKVSDTNKWDLIGKIQNTNKELAKLKKLQTGSPTIPQLPTPNPDYRATGFLIDGKGYIVTNAHVVNRLKKVYVENYKGEWVQSYLNVLRIISVNGIVDLVSRTLFARGRLIGPSWSRSNTPR